MSETGNALMRNIAQWRLAARFARREARSGFGGFRIFFICLALGVASIAAVGLMAQSFREGLVVEGRAILGGDIELMLAQRRIGQKEKRFLEEHGDLSEVATMRAMAHMLDGSDSALIEIKAIDRAYPYFGTVKFNPSGFVVANIQKSSVIAVDPILLARFNLKIGDQIKIGDGVFTIAAVVISEPDRIATGLTFGPRVFMSHEDIKATNLIKPGSLIRWRYRVRLDDSASPKIFRKAVNLAHPNAGWRIRDRDNSAPRLKRFIDRLAMLLTFVALTGLVIGGVGIGTAVKTYLDARVKTIAMLKCLGASSTLIFRIYLIHLLRLVVLGSGLGLIAGVLLNIGLGPALQNLMPLPAKFALYWPPLVVAACYGVLVTLIFALWSLGSACAVPAAALFRAHINSLPSWPPLRYAFGTLVLLAILIALTFWLVLDARFAAIYAGGTIGSFILFWAISKAIIWMARHVRPPGFRIFRLALIQLRASGHTMISTVIALGLGLTLLVSLSVIQGNFVRHLLKELPRTAPSFFFVDIQPNQLVDFQKIIKQTPNVKKFDYVPMLRGRIMRLNGITTDKIKASPNVQWVLSGDRGITYAAAKPKAITLVQGQWWPSDYNGPPLVSFAEDIANGLGLKVGDHVTVNVLGREITAKIASLRRIVWGSLGINFVMVFSPNPVSHAPHTFLSTIAMDEAGEIALMRRIAGKFANITALRVREILQSVNNVMEKLLLAARLAAGLTLFVGIVVLIGALASGQRARRYDAVILKTLGLTRPELIRVYVLEHALLGIVTGLIAAFCGTIIAYGLLVFVFKISWTPLWATVSITIIGAVITTIVLGLGGTWRVLGVRPARILHNE